MRPLVPVLLAFISGILIGARFGFSYEYVYICLAISFIPPVFSYVSGRKFNPYVSALPFFFLGSLFILPCIRPELPPCHLKNFLDGRQGKAAEGEFGPFGEAVEGEVMYPPEFMNGRTRLYIGAERILRDNKWKNTCGTILLTVEGADERFAPGDRVRFIGSLREPRDFGNPGDFDYRAYLSRKGIFVTGFVKDGRLIEKTGTEGGVPGRYIEAVRARIRSFIDGTDLKNGEIVKALVIAESRGIDPGIREAFIRTGTVHILVIAGLHVGFVALFSYGLFLFLLKRSERLMLGLNVKKLAAVLTVVPVVAYGLLAGFPVSTKRAVVMVLAFTASFIFDRGKDLYNTLALAALIILLIYPYSLWETSFQLSFAAVFSIIYLVPRLEGLWDRRKKDPLEKDGRLRRFFRRSIVPAFFVTLAAGLGTSPLLAYHFHRVSVVGLAANLIAVPLTGLILPVILTSILIFPFWEGLARVPLYAADAGLDLMVRIIKFFSAIPYASVWVSTPTVLEIILFYALVICAANIRKKRICAYLVPIIVLAMVVDWGWWSYGPRWDRELRVTFLNVGQGESSLIEFPGGDVMLVDGGGRYGSGFDIGERVVAPFLWSKKIKKIDYMVLSRDRFDYMAGLKFIARNFKIGEFWWNGDGSLGGLGKILSGGGIRIRAVDDSAGKMTVGGATVEVLNPHRGLLLDNGNTSLVLKVTYGRESFLFTGDIGKDAERELITRDIRSAVLKAPRRQGRDPSSLEFFRTVNPSFVVVSAGRGNVSVFPAREAPEGYGIPGARIYRTGKDGAVTFTTDGRDLRVRAYLTEAAQ